MRLGRIGVMGEANATFMPDKPVRWRPILKMGTGNRPKQTTKQQLQQLVCDYGNVQVVGLPKRKEIPPDHRGSLLYELRCRTQARRGKETRPVL